MFVGLHLVLYCLICINRQCPVDLRESLSSLIFKYSICDDIPELLDIHKLFGAKYGKKFVTVAAELHPNCGVNRTICPSLIL
jgi:vacuolar protein sorting-associated protein IST1